MVRRRLFNTILVSLVGGISLIATAGCGQSELDAQKIKDHESDLRDNMRLVQIAAEHFAGAHGANTYPKNIDGDFKTYFRGGVEGKTSAVVGLVNPFTNVNEFPDLGTMADPIAARSGPRFSLAPGKIQYCPLAGGKGYAIVGGAHDGKVLTDAYNPDQILVLTNVTH